MGEVVEKLHHDILFVCMWWGGVCKMVTPIAVNKRPEGQNSEGESYPPYLSIERDDNQRNHTIVIMAC